jgi:outer membrane protein OmpA-like peptidoglycan-associated protein
MASLVIRLVIRRLTDLPRHRRRALAVAVTLAALLAGPVAHAIGNGAPLDVNRFHPATGSGRILTIDLADVGRPYEVVPQLVLHYADLPLAYTFANRIQGDVVRDRLTADFAVSVSLLRRLQLSLALPVTLYQGGDSITYTDVATGTPRTLPRAARGGQEDLRLGIKGRFWNNEHFGVGGVLTIAFPTGNANSYLGSSNVTGEARAIGHYIYKRLTVALNVGWRWAAAEERLLNVRAGNSLSYGGAVQVEVLRRRDIPLYLLGEVYGLAHYRFESLVDSPVEAMFAAKTQVKDWTVWLGAGPGLDRGYGEPNVRVIAGVAYNWHPMPRPPRPPKPPRVEPPPPPLPPPPPPKVTVPVEGDRLQLGEVVHFESDRADIKPESYPLLDDVSNFIRSRPELGPIRIDGHTDNTHTEDYNLGLSRRRAEAVRDYLTVHGVARDRLSVAGYGERCPLVGNETPEQRAINRRVDFIIVDRERRHPKKGECPERPTAPSAPPASPSQNPKTPGQTP